MVMARGKGGRISLVFNDKREFKGEQKMVGGVRWFGFERVEYWYGMVEAK